MVQMRLVLFLLLLINLGCSTKKEDASDFSYLQNSETPNSETTNSETPSLVPDKTVVDDPGKLENTFALKTHDDHENGFSIGIPSDWKVIPLDALIAQGEAVGAKYIAGFQSPANEYFVHPYILVTKLRKEALPRDQIKKAQSLFRDKGSEVSEKLDEKTGLDMNMEIGKPVLEEKTGTVWLKIQLDGVEGEKIEGLMAFYYADDYILQFAAGTTATRGEADWPILEHVLRNISVSDSK